MRLRLAWLLFGTTSFFAATAAAQPAPPPGPPPPSPSTTTAPVPPPGPALQPTVAPQPPPSPTMMPPQNPPGPPGPPFQGPPQGPPAGPSGPPSGPPQGPPAGQGWQPPSQGWQGGPPAPAPVLWTPPAAAADESPGVSHGVPLARRGQIAIEASGFTDDSGQDSLLALALNLHLPIAERTFADARLPMASYFPGNIMLGASRVSKLDARGFLTYGAQLGLPLVTNRALFAFSLPHGLWNMHEYQANFMPIKLAAGYERTFGSLATFRLDLEPVLSVPIGDHGDNVGFTLQHALELQFGHSFGGGLRVQGVAATESLISDAYQLSVEPFVVVKRELGFARLGIMLPLDESTAGPAFEQAWGLRLAAGIHID